MIETLVLLLLAHTLGDYPLQSKWMIDHKPQAKGMAAHIGVHAVLVALALGQQPQWIAALVAAHLAMDLLKTHALPDRLWVYLADQAVHMGAILAAVWLGAQTRWALPPEAFQLALLLTGLILATQAGGPAMGYLMEPYKMKATQGLPEAGRTIGLLERGLIFLFVVIDQPTAIGFLIAAKSVLRFETASKEQKASEYVIIGTLASFGWALVVGYATVWGLEHVAGAP